MRRRAPALHSQSSFARIWKVVARIPRGRVATYGQVARLAGMPGAARLAGWALHALPYGLRIRGRPVPWQRVINAQGGISPRAGDALGEGMRQIRLLRREGVAVSRAGRIDLERYGWDGL
jgi:methylated-DNA-protein-cysteine methyltransferase related protein